MDTVSYRVNRFVTIDRKDFPGTGAGLTKSISGIVHYEIVDLPLDSLSLLQFSEKYLRTCNSTAYLRTVLLFSDPLSLFLSSRPSFFPSFDIDSTSNSSPPRPPSPPPIRVGLTAQTAMALAR